MRLCETTADDLAPLWAHDGKSYNYVLWEHPLGQGRSKWDVKEEAELLFLSQLDTVARETSNAQVRLRKRLAFLIGMQNLLATSFGISIQGRIRAAATPTGVTAIFLFAVGSVAVALPSPRFHSGDKKG